MATRGVPFAPPVNDIKDAILKHSGNIAMVAKQYKVVRETIYDFIYKHPILQEALEKARNYSENDMLDDAEHIMRLGLQMYDTDYKKAFEASKYVLDKKGYKRGWGGDGKPQHEKTVDNQLGTLIAQSEEIYNKMKEAQ